jgi:hypothetical protein
MSDAAGNLARMASAMFSMRHSRGPELALLARRADAIAGTDCSQLAAGSLPLDLVRPNAVVIAKNIQLLSENLAGPSLVTGASAMFFFITTAPSRTIPPGGSVARSGSESCSLTWPKCARP